MFAWKVAPALAAGNAVIVKLATLTTLSAYRLVQLAHEAGVPEASLILLTGSGKTIGEALGRHMDVDMVSFTGSTELGRLFLKYATDSNLKEIVLEYVRKLQLRITLIGGCFHQRYVVAKAESALSDWKVGLPD